MPAPGEDAQLRVPDQRMCPSRPRNRHVLVFRPGEDQRRHLQIVQPVDVIGAEAAPLDLVSLPGSSSPPHPRFLRRSVDLVHEVPRDELGTGWGVRIRKRSSGGVMRSRLTASAKKANTRSRGSGRRTDVASTWSVTSTIVSSTRPRTSTPSGTETDGRRPRPRRHGKLVAERSERQARAVDAWLQKAAKGGMRGTPNGPDLEVRRFRARAEVLRMPWRRMGVRHPGYGRGRKPRGPGSSAPCGEGGGESMVLVGPRTGRSRRSAPDWRRDTA